jgi:hypothetical protein
MHGDIQQTGSGAPRVPADRRRPVPAACAGRRRSARLASGLALSLGLAVTVCAEPMPRAADRDASLERCRYLHKRIAHYTRLRRAGGNTGQMERWRRQRQGYESEYRERRCYRFGGRLTVNR